MTVFLSFEGVDKTGKSTQITELSKKLQEFGYNTLVYQEPGTTTYGESIRKLVRSGNTPENPLAQYLMFSSARAEFVVKNLRPSMLMKSGINIVLCDRYVDSSWVYNGNEIAPSIRRAIDEIATYGIMPDKTFMFDISFATYLKRVQKSDTDSFEPKTKEDFVDIQQRYFEICKANPNRCLWVNCDDKQQTEITEHLFAEIAYLLKSKNIVTEKLEGYLKSH